MATATKSVIPMTRAQRRVWEYMIWYQQQHGFPPSMRDISVALKLSHSSGARSHVLSLTAKGQVVAHQRGLVCRYVAIPQPKENGHAAIKTRP